ncbi:MAG: DUF362 domain-containing protein, partial [Bacteroidales bacterium]|nr:DUF362 domain-containing protein [Bacteroidales bacterium]
MNRRNFLKTFALAGIGLAVKPAKSLAALVPEEKKAEQAVDLVAVMGGEPDQMFKKAIAEFGGMNRFVKSGQKVCIKPNIGWDRVPERAGNTNPLLITEIIRQCFAAGASEVTVFDHTCDDWVKCYQNSGIEAAAKAAGAKVLPANQESYYRQVELPQGKILKDAKIHQAILDS